MRAFLLLLLLFPVLELYVFFQVSTAIGFFPALLLIVAGSILGLLVVRVVGLATALRTRESMQRGELPAEQMFQGLMLAVGGGLLLVPGFVSDLLGVILMLPPTRRLIARTLRRRAEEQALRQRAFSEDLKPRGGANVHIEQPASGRQPDVIEGDFERRDP
ncbi:FxsA family protein [Pseudomonas sp. HR96]|uniref:FxsA family protein n=1 Tax=Pseudomonas sp. HR96 TaxID=1027966 RepID=UPI002A760888|nr:FxsA family protein [Pseudomonas sp. HR96]WPO99159.1 FxsA family protein [Pseudomonas sp. HR96]